MYCGMLLSKNGNEIYVMSTIMDSNVCTRWSLHEKKHNLDFA